MVLFLIISHRNRHDGLLNIFKVTHHFKLRLDPNFAEFIH